MSFVDEFFAEKRRRREREQIVEYYFANFPPCVALIHNAKATAQRISERVAKREQLNLLAPDLTFSEREQMVDGKIVLQ